MTLNWSIDAVSREDILAEMAYQEYASGLDKQALKEKLKKLQRYDVWLETAEEETGEWIRYADLIKALEEE